MSMNPNQAEVLRQLRAARDGRFLCNEHGRYVIEGEARPDRKTREKLLYGGSITWARKRAASVGLSGGMDITEKGRHELDRFEASA